MRITNTMMMNSTLKNVGRSKSNLNDLENQMSTEKKITRPSDDPIIAIRALSLRASLSEVNQYLKSNIPDAQSWLEVTEGALTNMDGILQDVYKYCTQGSSDQFMEEDRGAIIKVLNQYKEALYCEANTDNAGRYCFTGYKTDTSFTFLTQENADKTYEITQTFSGDDISTDSIMKNSVDVDNITNIAAADTPEAQKVYRLRLAYQGCEAAPVNAITADGTDYTPVSISKSDFDAMVSDGTFDAATNKAYYIYDTGEVAMTDDLYATLKDAKDISFTYTKSNFQKTDPRPEMYFNCKDITDAANPIDYTLTEGGQAISYTINFSQSIQVNTLGKDTLSYDIGRDIDDMTNALMSVKDIEDKITKLTSMKESALYSDAEKESIDTMITAANKELDYAKDNMQSVFSREMTRVKGYQATVDLQLSDLGARSTRLTLTKSRLTEQQTSFEDLKSKNEDAELEDTVIQYSAAQTLYEAALGAAAKCVSKTLLDYI